MSQQPWQDQLNQFIASLPQLLGLALGMGAITGMMGAVKGPSIPGLMAHTRKPEGLTAKRRPGRDDLKVETWFERDRAFVGIKDVTTGQFIAEWWDDDVQQAFEDGFFKSGARFKDSVLDYAERLGLLASNTLDLQPDTIRKSHPVHIYGVWLWEVPATITEAEMNRPIPEEGWELVHMSPGQYQSPEEARGKLPRHRMKPGTTYVLAIGKGDHFEAVIVKDTSCRREG